MLTLKQFNELKAVKLWGDTIILISPEQFDRIKSYRKERIEESRFYNNGSEVCDPYAQRGVELSEEEGGSINVTGMELAVVMSRSEYDNMRSELGRDFSSYKNPENYRFYHR